MQAAAKPTKDLTTRNEGVEANTRLTSATGLVLLVMLAVEGYTILDVRGMITLHIVLGVMLVGPVLLKTASTMYRFSRYYTHDEAYVRKGPPHPILRVTGPLVILSSLTVLGTGIGLVYLQSARDTLLLLHKASFIVWFGLMTIHVLGHILEALRAAWGEIASRPRGYQLRLGVIVVSLVAGVALATAVLPSATSWTHRSPDSIGQHKDR